MASRSRAGRALSATHRSPPLTLSCLRSRLSLPTPIPQCTARPHRHCPPSLAPPQLPPVPSPPPLPTLVVAQVRALRLPHPRVGRSRGGAALRPPHRQRRLHRRPHLRPVPAAARGLLPPDRAGRQGLRRHRGAAAARARLLRRRRRPARGAPVDGDLPRGRAGLRADGAARGAARGDGQRGGACRRRRGARRGASPAAAVLAAAAGRRPRLCARRPAGARTAGRPSGGRVRATARHPAWGGTFMGTACAGGGGAPACGMGR